MIFFEKNHILMDILKIFLVKICEVTQGLKKHTSM
jgi:hypothetical protein